MLKIQEICLLKRFIFTSKCTKMRFVSFAPPDLIAGLIRGRGGEWKRVKGGEGKGGGSGREKGRVRRKSVQILSFFTLKIITIFQSPKGVDPDPGARAPLNTPLSL